MAFTARRRQDYFRENIIWPVWLRFGRLSGLTISAGGDDEVGAEDYVLARDDTVLLFPDSGSLWSFIQHGGRSNLTGRANFERYQVMVRTNPEVWLRPAWRVNVDRSLREIERGGPKDVAAAQRLVTSLNMLIDLAHSVRDAKAANLLLHGPARILVDVLTFLEPAELDCIRTFRVPFAREDIREASQRLAPMVRLV